MGEAKRRKQRLGAAYGKKQPPLKNGYLMEMHLEKLVKATMTKVDQLLDHSKDQESIKEYRETTEKELIQVFRTWLDAYLANYEPEDRERLASQNVNLLLDAFFEFNASRKSKIIFSTVIILEASEAYLDEELGTAVRALLERVDGIFEKIILEEEAKQLEE